jgi:hypothetical protein
MSRNEVQTRRYLIDLVLSNLGWTNDLIKVEVILGGKYQCHITKFKF